jgi:hypothetical protein
LRVLISNPDGSHAAGAEAVADEGGGFVVWPRDGDGNLARPRAGQRVEVVDMDTHLALEVPDVTGSYDLDANRLHGTGVPGTQVSLVVWNPYRPEYAEPSATVGPDATWSLDPGIDVEPASHFYVTQSLPHGDQAFYCLQVPAVHVQPGSPVLGVEALWDVAAQIRLERAGQVVGTAAGSTPFEGWLPLTLRDADGEPVSPQAGDRIVGTLDGVARSFDIEPLEAAITAAGVLEGRTSPGQTVVLSDRATIDTDSADSEGAFSFDVSEYTHRGWATEGESFGAFVRAATGDHVRAQFQGPRVSAVLDLPEVYGLAMPGAPFTLTRRSGAVAESVRGVAGLDGAVRVSFSEPVGVHDAVLLETGPVSTTLEIPELTAALDESTHILSGKGPAHTIMTVDAYLRQAAFPERLYTRADESGVWSLDLMARDDGGPVVDTLQVSRLRLESRTGANDTSLVVPGPERTARTVFLPGLRTRLP